MVLTWTWMDLDLDLGLGWHELWMVWICNKGYSHRLGSSATEQLTRRHHFIDIFSERSLSLSRVCANNWESGVAPFTGLKWSYMVD
jgi:hypothetical protein